MQRWIDRLSIGFLLIVFGIGMPLLWAAQIKDHGQAFDQTADGSPPSLMKEGTPGQSPATTPDSKFMILISTQHP